MKKVMFAIILAAIIGCSKEPTPEPEPTEFCLECTDNLTSEQVTICDDTLSIRVWTEFFRVQNESGRYDWVCKKVPAVP